MSEEKNTGIFILELKELSERYVPVYYSTIRDKKLSLKAKALHCFLRSFPSGWLFHVEDLSTRIPEGRDAVSAGLKELEARKYLERSPARGEGGKFNGYIYQVFCMRKDRYIRALKEDNKLETKR